MSAKPAIGILVITIGVLFFLYQSQWLRLMYLGDYWSKKGFSKNRTVMAANKKLNSQSKSQRFYKGLLGLLMALVA